MSGAVVVPTIKTDADTLTGRYSKHYELLLSGDGAAADTMTPLIVDPRVQRITIQVTVTSGTPSVNLQGALALANNGPAAGDWVDSGQAAIATTKTFQMPYIPQFLKAIIAITLGVARINIDFWG